MGIFNTEENIGKIKFGEMFTRIRVIYGYKGVYSATGLFFVEPEAPDYLDDMSPDIPELIKLVNRKEDVIQYVTDNIKGLDDVLIDSNTNIPTQLSCFFDNCPSIQDIEVDPRFMCFDNKINVTFRTVAEQHELRHRFGQPGFGPIERCAYIHFKFHTKLNIAYRADEDIVHWFLPVELKEGWG